MAERPVFIPSLNEEQLVEVKSIPFRWNPGMAASQKRKNVVALHEAASKVGIESILEISTKSEDPLGFELSAFNLSVLNSEYLEISLESAYQGSKVFQFGGPYLDFHAMHGREIKKDQRLRTSGELRFFSYGEETWELEPKTAFYDWLYINAVFRKDDAIERLTDFDGFTDIEYNPKKSINCQARACAMYVSLHKRGILSDVLEDHEAFLEVSKLDAAYQSHSSQIKLI
jgi:hypothetical protein